MSARPERTPQPFVARTPRKIEDQVKKILPASVQGAEFASQIWRATPEDDVTIEDTLKAEYWCNLVGKFDPGHKIEAVWADNSKFAEYLVLSVGTAWVKVALLRVCHLKEEVGALVSVNIPEEVKSKDYKIEFSGPKKWAVFRISDGERMKADFNTEQEAKLWVADFEQNLKK
jgi:hypothetical protein